MFNLAEIEPVKNQPYPFTSFQLEWLEALKSGEYKQGQGYLCDANNGYCCLGVLMELAGIPKHLGAMGYKSYTFEDRGQKYFSTLSYDVRKAAHLRDDMGRFERRVKFNGVFYGAFLLGASFNEAVTPSLQGHGSLAAMNDARVIPVGAKFRAFTLNEIADYIRHDPWNVFEEPVDAPNISAAPLQLEGAAA